MLLLAAVAACGGPGRVTVTPPASGAASVDTACAHVAATLPQRVHGLSRRDVTPASDRTAAWGDPPIVLLCGVGRPAGLQADTTLLTVDGVDWFSQQLTRGTRFTATGRVAYVRVDVPEDYTSASDALADLTAAVRTVPVAD